MNQPFYTRPVPPLVLRHAQDAAWYWSQMEADRLSPLIDTECLAHYQTLLACHLEGLHLAGKLGWELARKELERWKDPEQHFVCWHLVLHSSAPQPQEKITWLWSLLECLEQDAQEDVVEAAAAALIWCETKPAHWLNHWLRQNIPLARSIAVRALAAYAQPLPAHLRLEDLLTDNSPSLAAAVCRLAGALTRHDLVNKILAAAQTANTAFFAAGGSVREEAGIALLRLGHPAEALPFLAEAMFRQHELAAADAGGRGLRAEHRAQVLACLCGHALPSLSTLSQIVAPGMAKAQTAGLSPQIPPYLLLHILAHHGDPQSSDLLLEQMKPESPHAARALRALCMMTGLDAESAGLCLPAILPGDPGYDDPPPRHPGHLLDSGLPIPDYVKVQNWLTQHKRDYPEGVRLLRGKRPDSDLCRDILQKGLQDERFAAAWHCARLKMSLRSENREEARATPTFLPAYRTQYALYL